MNKRQVTFGGNTIRTIPNRNSQQYRAEQNQEITLGRYACLQIEEPENKTERRGTEQTESNNTNPQRPKKPKRKRIRKNKHIVVALVNVNGIKGKIKSLESMLQAEKVGIALITETKLAQNSKVNVRGYRWSGKNRKKQNRRWSRNTSSGKTGKVCIRRQYQRRIRRR